MRRRLLATASLFSLVAAALLEPTAQGVAAAAMRCDELSLRQRAAQTVMSGISSNHFTEETRRIVRRDAGSVILLGHNISGKNQLERLITRMRRNAPRRLLVSVDEEGGRVARLGSEGLVTRLPSARDLARSSTIERVRRLGRKVGEQMRRLGINWNLAPVLDVTGAPDNTVIGDRSYSYKRKRVTRYGRAFAVGLGRGGVMTAGKHFPGHGRTSVDSHDRMPTVKTPLRKLRRRDLMPYRLENGSLDAVMMAHVRFTALDKRRPASLSRAATQLLRKEIGFDGLIVTDALGMGAITNTWSVPQAATLALRAGADMVLSTESSKADDIVHRIASAVRAGKLRRARLNHAVERVLTAKGYGKDKIACLLS